MSDPSVVPASDHPQGSGPARPAKLWLARSLPALIVAFAVLAVLLVVRPFAPPPPEREVWEEWNETIGRLGLVPVYPPHEDLYVGDVLIVLGNGPSGPAGQRRLGNAITIAHLDLRNQIAAHEAHRLNLDIDASPTAPQGAVHAGLLAYPGISVTHARHAAASFAARLFGWNAESEKNSTDKVSIPVAYTYGVEPYDGLIALSAFCRGPATALFCDDAFLHRLLARSGLDYAAATNKAGRFVFPITIELVTRVYLTRSLEQQHVLQGSGGAAIAAATPSSTPAAAPSPNPAAVGAPVQPQTPQPPPAQPGEHTSLSLVRADDSEVTLHQTYDHPLVFGYRMVAIRTKGAPK